jgi:hypothetical protein
MFKLPDGIQVNDLSGIAEAYCEFKPNNGTYLFKINVSCENIADYFTYLIPQIGQPGFFLVELPLTEQEELKLRKEKTDPFHKNIYYLDGISVDRAEEIFNQYQRLFIHDGMVNFGYGTQTDEVFVGSYKIFSVFTRSPEKIRKAMTNLNIEPRDKLQTIWDNLSKDSPGTRFSLDEKPSTRDMIEELKQAGFYLAETRED